jgi:hypothetical protein
VNARLAAALLTATRVLAPAGVSFEALTALIDHLWRWPTIDEYTFVEWERWSNPMLESALDGVVAEESVPAVQQSSISHEDFRTLIESTVEIVYVNLFAAVDHGRTLDHLERVAMVASRAGVGLPPAALFAAEAGADVTQRSGWGARMTAAQVNRWRAMRW